MWKWPSKSPVEEVVEAVKDRGTVTPPPLPPERFEEPAYQVGITESGKITLRIGYSTLTMNKAGVHKLIQMLEVAVEAQTEETEGHDGRGPG